MSCKCQKENKQGFYECGAFLDDNCPNPCPDGEFFCEKATGQALALKSAWGTLNKPQCISDSLKCNSVDNCNNWKDEEGCRISSDDIRLVGTGNFYQMFFSPVFGCK